MPNRQSLASVFSVTSNTSCAALVGIMLFVVLVVAPLAQAQTFQVIYNFSGTTDGANPLAGVTVDNGGNLYCTTSMGGTVNRGTVCRLTHNGSEWTLKSLYSFAGPPDASVPIAPVVIGPDGSLYGTTEFGGENCGGNAGCGTVYRLQPPVGACKTVLCPWLETIVYKFTGGSDGANPGYGDVVFDAAGNLYGTTYFGGNNAQGVVFKLTHSGGSWTESAIHTFEGPDGINPFSGVTFDSAGNLYGTTNLGGANNSGTVYELLSPNWTESTLYSFQASTSGGTPYGGVIFDSAGNLYGGTSSGGTGNGGTVFELTPSGGSWSFDLLYNLTGTSYQPGVYSNLVRDASGNLYGTTKYDGANGAGSVFKLTPSGGDWVYSSLHDFTGGTDGANPIGAPIFDANGNLFGTAKNGGAHGDGVVWEITP